MSDCSKAPECALLGREACSLDSPENTCGSCRTVPVGNRTDEWGNDTCVTVSVSNTLFLASTAPGRKVPVSRTDSQGVSCVTETSEFPTSFTAPHCKYTVIMPVIIIIVLCLYNYYVKLLLTTLVKAH